MRSGASRPDDPADVRAAVLAARDARQATLDRHLARHLTAAPSAVVAVALNLPGARKRPPGADALFRWALERLCAALPGAALLEARRDALGPFAVVAAAASPREVKAACLAIEEDAAHPAARLVDLDVYGPGGAAADRASLGLPARRCLLCGAPARECIRVRRHLHEEVEARAHALLSGFADLPPDGPT